MVRSSSDEIIHEVALEKLQQRGFTTLEAELLADIIVEEVARE